MNRNNLIIKYDNVQVKQGNYIDMNRFINKPTIYYPYIKNIYYSLLMVDIDAPTKSKPIYKYWIHWMIGNIYSSTQIHNNDNLIYNNIYGLSIIDYMSPTPQKGTGPHRYVFLLYKQPYKLNYNYEYPSRKKFNVKEYANKYNLELLNIVYFKCEYSKYDN
jgi:phosphatidylethanolamine-binding protein (PEBP) family uncharacterized protein